MGKNPKQLVAGSCSRLALILLAALTVAGCLGPIQPAGGENGRCAACAADSALLPGWGSPVFRDEFDGGLRQWTVRDHATHGSLSYDRSILSRRQVTVGDGLLAITGRRLEPSAAEGNRSFVTGYVDSSGSFSQQYGRWEIRAKLPLPPGSSQGIWPAFWLRPDAAATGGEIDILEAYGTAESAPFGLSTAEKTQASVHYDQTGSNKTTGWTPLIKDLHKEFHVWAVEWTPAGIVFSLDGRIYKSVFRDDHPDYSDAFESGTGFHMRLNLQYGSEYWGFPDPADPGVTADEARFLVDYVRVWQYDGG